MRMIAVVGLAVGIMGFAQGGDKKADPTGTWKWTTEFNDRKVEQVLKLKLEGDKLTGTLGRDKNETKIEDGKFKDGEVTFTVTRERNGVKVVNKFKAKVEGTS